MVDNPIPPGQSLKRLELPVTPARRQAFLDALALTGIWTAACRAGSPHTKWGGDATWRDLMARDPKFREEVEQAKAQAAQTIVTELHRRAVTGWDEPVFSAKGQRSKDHDGKPASVHKYSDRLLEIALRNRYLFPSGQFAQHSTVDSNVSVEHRNRADVVEFSKAELMALPLPMRQKAVDVLRALSNQRQRLSEADAEVFDRQAEDVEAIVDVDAEPVEVLEEWETADDTGE